MEEMCATRNDEWGETVLLRLAGILNDVVASDGRYHKDCKRDFFLKFKDLEEGEEQDVYLLLLLLLEVINIVKTDRSRIRNSVELYNLYTSNNNNVVDCRSFIKNSLNYFDGALVSFHAHGYAKLLCFNEHVRGVLKMVMLSKQCYLYFMLQTASILLEMVCIT